MHYMCCLVFSTSSGEKEKYLLSWITKLSGKSTDINEGILF